MRERDSPSGPGQNGTPPAPVPLFRPEALDAQQQKFYGEILLLRPLSLTLSAWVGTGIAALVAAFLFWGSWTEVAHVAGTLRPPTEGIEAQFEVPARWIAYVQPGEKISLRCPACEGPLFRQAGTVTKIVPGTQASGASSNSEPFYQVLVAIHGRNKNPVPQGARVEADLPLERHRLFNWIFNRPAA
jgi:multidrug efflux pump subunit AcrA (membrane-fusion protein)